MVPISESSQPTCGRILIPGDASGDVLFSDVPLSFMMGVDAKTGIVIDRQHPLLGKATKDKLVVLPCGRGSCAASGVILELLLQDAAPAAFIFGQMEEILTLGVLLSKVMFSKSIPVVLIEDTEVFAKLESAETASIRDGRLYIGESLAGFPLSDLRVDGVSLTHSDRNLLAGKDCSIATQMAMEILVAFAAIQQASELIDVSQVHVDACCYVGESSLLVPQKLYSLGGRFVVPSTCNSLNVDLQRWKELGTDPELSKIASQVGDVYLAMGSEMSFTCAPYLLKTKPRKGEQIGWGESNAVVFANSVLGSRTQKYPDYLDVMIALTGRAPLVGCHLSEGRVPHIVIDVPALPGLDDSIFPLLGYHTGDIVGSRIPFIFGLEKTGPEVPDLKAFGAGFATTSSAPMFHINGVTPEAVDHLDKLENLERVTLKPSDLQFTWGKLNTASGIFVDVISLGNPHFALEEFERLVKLTSGRTKRRDVGVIITTNRYVYGEAAKRGYVDEVERFGALIITDTCWCMLEEPVIPPASRSIMTNSAKYAHYGPGVSKRTCHFGSMAACVDAACTGNRSSSKGPSWLFERYFEA